MKLTSSIITKGTSSVIITDEELYQFNKTDQSEGRITEARLYEQAAIDRFARECQVYIGNYTGQYKAPCFFNISIQETPVLSLNHIKYFDESNVEQTLNDSEYYYNINDGVLKIQFTGTMPAVYDRPDAVNISFTLGYLSATIPSIIKHAIIQSVTYWFNNPEEASRNYPTSFDRVINQFRRNWV